VWRKGDVVAFYTHDGNKNVSEVITADGTLAAHYEYAPFGAVIAQHGASAAVNPWRFSSEYAEDDTATVYYNYRHYEPKMGRWTKRDRIEESGGAQLYAAFYNDPVVQFDSEGDVIAEVVLAALLAEVANHYICDWHAHDGLDNETDAYKHCMVSCRYSKCTSILNGKLIAAINTFLGGVVYEIVSSNNTWEGAIDDIKSNLIGIVHSFIPFESCEKACECERGRWNR
jgi:RHS repeat-associated protein